MCNPTAYAPRHHAAVTSANGTRSRERSNIEREFARRKQWNDQQRYDEPVPQDEGEASEKSKTPEVSEGASVTGDSGARSVRRPGDATDGCMPRFFG